MNRIIIGILIIPFMISCQKTERKTNQNLQSVAVQKEIINEDFEINDCDIKITNRPDGNVIKYFNPTPVIQNEEYDIALSLYFNETTSTYFISTSVLFKDMEVKSLTGDLLIQTDSSNGIQLTQVLSNQVNMKGKKLSVALYELTKRDIEILKKSNLKSVFIYLDRNQYGSTLDINRNLIAQQFKCFLNQ